MTTGGPTPASAAARRLFGTDGIRAPFGEPPLDRSTVTALGYHLAMTLGEAGARPAVVLGGDTRSSTPEICRWLATGLEAGGADYRYAGVLPTPGVAFLVRELGAAAGVSVSASHNPYPDNGIKLFDRDGFKYAVAAEAALEERLRSPAPPLDGGPASPPQERGLAARYLDSVAALLPGDEPLAGLRVVLDAAHGAASPHAAPLFRRLGAEVTSLFDRPDGTNINRGCGSTQPEALARAVVDGGHHLGIAFDGDADRALFVDENGELRDGDAVLYLWGQDLKRHGRLEPAAVVATSMSNLGLERALDGEGIRVVRCDVGDRVVVETMRHQGIHLGGEQSGHIVHLGLTSTGDGLVTALKVAALVHQADRPFSRLLDGFRRFPQVLRNLRVSHKPDLATLPGVAAAVRSVEERLGRDGRLVLRYSGTEPLARVMIEGAELEEIETMAAEILDAIRADLAAPGGNGDARIAGASGPDGRSYGEEE